MFTLLRVNRPSSNHSSATESSSRLWANGLNFLHFNFFSFKVELFGDSNGRVHFKHLAWRVAYSKDLINITVIIFTIHCVELAAKNICEWEAYTSRYKKKYKEVLELSEIRAIRFKWPTGALETWPPLTLFSKSPFAKKVSPSSQPPSVSAGPYWRGKHIFLIPKLETWSGKYS